MTANGRVAPGPPVLVLASTSPRRRELLLAAGIAFVVGRPGIEPEGSGPPAELALLRARSKAAGATAPSAVAAPLLGVDTIVDVDGRDLGQPADREAAAAMLRELAGRMHRVHTAHCLFDPVTGHAVEELVSAVVVARIPSPGELAAYLDSGEWRGKAGGYGIQDRTQSFLSLAHGSLDTVIGLHVAAVRRLLDGMSRR